MVIAITTLFLLKIRIYVKIGQNHTWTKKGTFEIRVTARDKYGTVCSWSNPLSATVENTRPTKPSTPDGHDIKYGFDYDGDDQNR
jgi:hypothetical protein